MSPLVHLKDGVEKGGKIMIAIAHTMGMAVPKTPAEPHEARGCPASMQTGQRLDR